MISACPTLFYADESPALCHGNPKSTICRSRSSPRSRRRPTSNAYANTISSRQALRYVIRNTQLPQRTRAQAQLKLSQMHAYTRPTQIRNRSIEGGKTRGIFREFRMSRVSKYNCDFVRARTGRADGKSFQGRSRHEKRFTEEPSVAGCRRLVNNINMLTLYL
jgi:ribosomal protein S14